MLHLLQDAHRAVSHVKGLRSLFRYFVDEADRAIFTVPLTVLQVVIR